MTIEELREAKRVAFMDHLRQREERRKRRIGRTMTAREAHLNAAANEAPDNAVIFAQWNGSEFTGIWMMKAEGC